MNIRVGRLLYLKLSAVDDNTRRGIFLLEGHKHVKVKKSTRRLDVDLVKRMVQAKDSGGENS